MIYTHNIQVLIPEVLYNLLTALNYIQQFLQTTKMMSAWIHLLGLLHTMRCRSYYTPTTTRYLLHVYATCLFATLKKLIMLG